MADYDHAARLEPFLLLARSTKGAAAAKVISDATAAPGVYIFGELLALPGIADLANDANLAKSHQLLQLFAYGDLETYLTDKDSYPPLGPAHLLKLQHLTLVSLALQRRSLPYNDILAALQISSVRELEDLIIDVIYAGLLAGKMHHNEAVFHIDWVAGRDISPASLPIVQQRLEEWCATAQNLLAALDERIADVRAAAFSESATLAAYKTFRTEQYHDALKDKDSKKDRGRGTGGPRMDEYWGPERAGGRNESGSGMPGGSEPGGSGSGGGTGGGGGGGEGGSGKGPGLVQRMWVRLPSYHGVRYGADQARGNRLGGMSGEDGTKGRGSKRQRGL